MGYPAPGPARRPGAEPRRQRFFIISCSKRYIKLRVYFFMNQIIQQFTIILKTTICTTIGCLKLLADFIHRYSFFIVHACMEIKAKRCCTDMF